jgi:hypothetical protein
VVANIAVVVVIALVVAAVVYRLRRHGDGIVARRGMSIGADLGAMGDRPRVRVRAVTPAGADRVRLLLAPEAVAAEMDLVVALGEDEFGFDLLQRWQRSQCLLAIVIPPDSHLVRLRSIDDLQHLTLRRADDV